MSMVCPRRSIICQPIHDLLRSSTCLGNVPLSHPALPHLARWQGPYLDFGEVFHLPRMRKQMSFHSLLKWRNVKCLDTDKLRCCNILESVQVHSPATRCSAIVVSIHIDTVTLSPFDLLCLFLTSEFLHTKTHLYQATAYRKLTRMQRSGYRQDLHIPTHESCHLLSMPTSHQTRCAVCEQIFLVLAPSFIAHAKQSIS